MMIGKLFEFIDALLGKVYFVCGAGIDLLFGDSILIFGKIQFALYAPPIINIMLFPPQISA